MDDIYVYVLPIGVIWLHLYYWKKKSNQRTLQTWSIGDAGNLFKIWSRRRGELCPKSMPPITPKSFMCNMRSTLMISDNWVCRKFMDSNVLDYTLLVDFRRDSFYRQNFLAWRSMANEDENFCFPIKLTYTVDQSSLIKLECAVWLYAQNKRVVIIHVQYINNHIN